MKAHTFFLSLLLFIGYHGVPAQASKTLSQLKGAWEAQINNEDHVWIISDDGFVSMAMYNRASHEFIGTAGGKLELDDDQVVGLLVEYLYWARETEQVTIGGMAIEKDSWGKEAVNEIMPFTIDGITKKEMKVIMDGKTQTFKNIDRGKPGKLSGAWLFSQRKTEEGFTPPRTPGTRKTMKILSGTRFQWIAYDIKDGSFYGTGGGTYTTKGGKYTENIEFFSRDQSRVGASLTFDFEIQEGGWHHSGLNSKGEPLYEVWRQRKDLGE